MCPRRAIVCVCQLLAPLPDEDISGERSRPANRDYQTLGFAVTAGGECPDGLSHYALIPITEASSQLGLPTDVPDGAEDKDRRLHHEVSIVLLRRNQNRSGARADVIG